MFEAQVHTDNIRSILEQRKMQQDELAVLTGRTQSTITNFIAGKHFSAETGLRIALVLNVPPSDIFSYRWTRSIEPVNA